MLLILLSYNFVNTPFSLSQNPLYSFALIFISYQFHLVHAARITSSQIDLGPGWIPHLTSIYILYKC